jgi:hypothetical protein
VDREADGAVAQGGQYIVLVRATDSGNPDQLSEIMPVTIHINDVNEFTPEFSTRSFKVDVVENTAVGTLVTTVFATDADATLTHSTVTYSLSGDPAGAFAINASNGEIKVERESNREITAEYSLIIMASDGEKMSVQQVMITVLDENDNAPVIAGGSSRIAAIVEDLKAGLPIALGLSSVASCSAFLIK